MPENCRNMAGTSEWYLSVCEYNLSLTYINRWWDIWTAIIKFIWIAPRGSGEHLWICAQRAACEICFSFFSGPLSSTHDQTMPSIMSTIVNFDKEMKMKTEEKTGTKLSGFPKRGRGSNKGDAGVKEMDQCSLLLVPRQRGLDLGQGDRILDGSILMSHAHSLGTNLQQKDQKGRGGNIKGITPRHQSWDRSQVCVDMTRIHSLSETWVRS